jgi:hypothetical protein
MLSRLITASSGYSPFRSQTLINGSILSVSFLNSFAFIADSAVSALIGHEVLASESSRAPLPLVFSAKLASRWMPGLSPAQTD